MAQSDRYRRYRARRDRGVTVYRVEADRDLLHALLDAGRLTEAQALEAAQVERAIAGLIAEWVGRWRGEK